jgi:hypothetical protein
MHVLLEIHLTIKSYKRTWIEHQETKSLSPVGRERTNQQIGPRAISSIALCEKDERNGHRLLRRAGWWAKPAAREGTLPTGTAFRKRATKRFLLQSGTHHSALFRNA